MKCIGSNFLGTSNGSTRTSKPKAPPRGTQTPTAVSTTQEGTGTGEGTGAPAVKPPTMLIDLPAALLRVIAGHADATAAHRAACTCTAWRAAAGDRELLLSCLLREARRALLAQPQVTTTLGFLLQNRYSFNGATVLPPELWHHLRGRDRLLHAALSGLGGQCTIVQCQVCTFHIIVAVVGTRAGPWTAVGWPCSGPITGLHLGGHMPVELYARRYAGCRLRGMHLSNAQRLNQLVSQPTEHRRHLWLLCV